MVALNFDANQVAPNAGYEPVPAGWYHIAITMSEKKPTNDGQGEFLLLTYSIIEGPHTGKPLYDRLNTVNKSQKAVDIAYSQLSAICHVTGVYRFEDTVQLHNIPFQVRAIVSKSDEYGDGNEVKGYRDAAGNEPGKAPQGNTTPAQNTAQGNWGGNQAATQPKQSGGFDPNTGEPVKTATQQGKFDPNTGEPLGGTAWKQNTATQTTAPWGNTGK